MSDAKKVLAFIPARGGSKRLPGKNIRLFNGQPLIYYSIILARSCQQVDRVVVSTDDPQIEQVARACGAEVILRPAELSTDHSPTAAAIKHTILELQKTGYNPDLVVTLQPTNPLRPLALLDQAITMYLENAAKVDSVITVSLNQHKYGTIEKQRFVPHNYTPGGRSQDLQPLYYENGLVYVCNSRLILEQETPFGSVICPLITDELFARDIDTLLDFQIAEFLYRQYQSVLQEGLQTEPAGRLGQK